MEYGVFDFFYLFRASRSTKKYRKNNFIKIYKKVLGIL